MGCGRKQKDKADSKVCGLSHWKDECPTSQLDTLWKSSCGDAEELGRVPVQLALPVRHPNAALRLLGLWGGSPGKRPRLEILMGGSPSV